MCILCSRISFIQLSSLPPQDKYVIAVGISASKFPLPSPFARIHVSDTIVNGSLSRWVEPFTPSF